MMHPTHENVTFLHGPCPQIHSNPGGALVHVRETDQLSHSKGKQLGRENLAYVYHLNALYLNCIADVVLTNGRLRYKRTESRTASLTRTSRMFLRIQCHIACQRVRTSLQFPHTCGTCTAQTVSPFNCAYGPGFSYCFQT